MLLPLSLPPGPPLGSSQFFPDLDLAATAWRRSEGDKKGEGKKKGGYRKGEEVDWPKKGGLRLPSTFIRHFSMP